MNITILMSDKSWMQFDLARHLGSLDKYGIVSFKYTLSEGGDVAVILHYPALLSPEALSFHKHNLIIHAGDLPKGRGRSPIHWQVEKGLNKIPMTLFEAGPGPDDGPWYLKNNLILDGSELLPEIRRKTLANEIEMLHKWFKLQPKAKEQVGKPTYFKKRTRSSQRLDPNKTIAKQFNIMRVADNYNYPLWFSHKGHTYKLEIFDLESPRTVLFESDKPENREWIA